MLHSICFAHLYTDKNGEFHKLCKIKTSEFDNYLLTCDKQIGGYDEYSLTVPIRERTSN